MFGCWCCTVHRPTFTLNFCTQKFIAMNEQGIVETIERRTMQHNDGTKNVFVAGYCVVQYIAFTLFVTVR